MAHLNWNQRRKIAKLEEAAATYSRLARDCEDIASQNQQQGAGGRKAAAESREMAADYRQRRQQTKAEIADRKANPGKYRW